MTPIDLTRRAFLVSGAAVVAMGSAGWSAQRPPVSGGWRWAVPAPTGDEFDQLRLRWADLVLGDYDSAQEPYATLAAGLGDTAAMRAASFAPTGAGLWADLPLGSTSSTLATTCQRIRDIAIATRLPGSSVRDDAEVVGVVRNAVTYLLDNFYGGGIAAYDNWFHWELAGPKALLTAAAVRYDDLGEPLVQRIVAAVDQYSPVSVLTSYTGTSTGANRLDRCLVVALSGILGRSQARLAAARDAVSPVLPYVRSEDGFYRDGSYIQHFVFPYAGGYGSTYLTSLAELLATLAGSTWAITDPLLQNAFAAIDDSFLPLMHNGLIMDAFSGRYVANGIVAGKRYSDHQRGQDLMIPIIALADSGAVPADQADRWRRAVTGEFSRDVVLPWHERIDLTLANRARVDGLMKRGLDPTTPALGNRVYASGERVVHRRPEWVAALALQSSRVGYYETGNGEHLRGWHTGSGWLSIWTSDRDLGQFTDEFWCTIDPYRLAGTTVSTIRLADAEGGQWGATMPTTTYSGGASDGLCAAVGFEMQSLGSTISGRKSWFFFDDAIVCLGAGITARDGGAVETIIDNRNLGESGGAQIVLDEQRAGDAPVTAAVTTARIDGIAGYVFPGGATVTAMREDRTGSWRSISRRADDVAATRRYATLWIDHGVDPTDGTYHYEIVPGASKAQTLRRAATAAVVVSNDAQVQAVRDRTTATVGANFFAAGSSGSVTVSAACSVLVRESRRERTIVVADPSRASTSIELTLDESWGEAIESDDSVVHLGSQPLRLLVNVGGSLGASHRITVGKRGRVRQRAVARADVTADTYIRDGVHSGTSFFESDTLAIKNDALGYARQSYLRFAAPTGKIIRATLWVRARVADSAGTHATIAAYTVPGGWKDDLTWATAPALGQRLADHDLSDVEEWIPFDVSDAAIAGGEVSIGLIQEQAGRSVVIRSREAAVEMRPYVEIVTEKD